MHRSRLGQTIAKYRHRGISQHSDINIAKHRKQISESIGIGEHLDIITHISRNIVSKYRQISASQNIVSAEYRHREISNPRNSRFYRHRKISPRWAMSKYRFWKTSSQMPVAFHRHRGNPSVLQHDDIASPLHGTVPSLIATGKYRDSAKWETSPGRNIDMIRLQYCRRYIAGTSRKAL